VSVRCTYSTGLRHHHSQHHSTSTTHSLTHSLQGARPASTSFRQGLPDTYPPPPPLLPCPLLIASSSSLPPPPASRHSSTTRTTTTWHYYPPRRLVVALLYYLSCFAVSSRRLFVSLLPCPALPCLACSSSSSSKGGTRPGSLARPSPLNHSPKGPSFFAPNLPKLAQHQPALILLHCAAVRVPWSSAI
jgi:hypothetical protein